MDLLTLSPIVQPQLEDVADVLMTVLGADEQGHHSCHQDHQDPHEALEVTLRVMPRQLSPPGHHRAGRWSVGVGALGLWYNGRKKKKGKRSLHQCPKLKDLGD